MNYRKKWDVFICHASEDKREIADPLANKLTSMGLKVWYDKFSMRWGSRLMKEIDNGLVNSKYGIVILSNAFFDKGWPQRELEALFSLMVSEDNKDMILPLLHKVKFEDVKVRCPLISGILCRPSDIGVDALAKELVEVVRNKITRKQDMLQMTNKSHLALSNSIHLTSTSVELGELEEAKAAKLLRQFTNPGTPEVREAAYSELYALCSKKKVWKQQHIWKILDSLLLHPKKDSSDMIDSLAILDNILKSASRTSDMNEVTDRISKSYQHRLREILHYIAPEFQTHRLMAVTILGRALNFQQLFSICWESWKKGLKEIESEYCYSEYLKPLLQIFDQASSEHTEAVRDEILKYLEDPIVMIRKRALDIYKLYFV